MLADRQYGFPLQIPGCAESVFRYVCQQPVFQQEKCIQFLFGCIQLLLQYLIIRGKSARPYQYGIQKCHFIFKVTGSRNNPLLQGFVRSIILCGVNQAVVLYAEPLRHFYHLFAETLHRLFVGGKLLGIEFIKMFIDQPYIALQRLCQRQEIKQFRQQPVKIGTLQ